MYRYLTRTNFHILAMNDANLSAWESGRCRLIIAPEFKLFDFIEAHLVPPDENGVADVTPLSECKCAGGGHQETQGTFLDGIYVSADIWTKEEATRILRTSLKGRAIQVVPSGDTNSMPWEPWMYAVEGLEELTPKTNLPYFPVEVQEEATFGDLLSHSYQYAYDAAANVYKKLSTRAGLKNFYRGFMQGEVMRVAGNDGARIADYGRLIALILQKIGDRLSTEEAALLAPLLEKQILSDTLAGIAGREQSVLQKVEDIVSRRVDHENAIHSHNG